MSIARAYGFPVWVKCNYFISILAFFNWLVLLEDELRKQVGAYWYENLDWKELLGFSSFEFTTLKFYPVFKNHLAILTHSASTQVPSYKIPLYYEFMPCVFCILKRVFFTGIQVDGIGTIVLLKCPLYSSQCHFFSMSYFKGAT